MKKSVILLTVAALCLSLFGCGDQREVLKVYNVGMYIDKSTIDDFEKEYDIRVVYDEFNTNEEMYVKIAHNENAYDIVVPSDYTIDRLIQEDRLAKINKENIPNFEFIAPEYVSPEYDPGNDYVVPYMVGTLGILYNTTLVEEPVDSWYALWDERYKGQIFMWDSMRDVIGPTLKMHGFSMNSEDDSQLAVVKERLIAQKPLVQAYVGDEIRDKMIAEEGALALIYSGDAKTAIDENENLAYVIPKEGSNKWLDGFVVLKNTQHLAAAEKFINFMCRPDIAIRNMTETGYTSPIKEAWAEFGDNPVMFPTAEELDNCEPFLYSESATQKYSDIWTEIRATR
ncbi:MAG: spermidine/putrescine ABC transporter substrate-binding protein [Clostridiales bacterium]|jgi:spermidine/putrescine transport system substrate-binding protein|nr:spermidine/putrescine ABC transporter substrate-binding protein [Clostridiales bacterium]